LPLVISKVHIALPFRSFCEACGFCRVRVMARLAPTDQVRHVVEIAAICEPDNCVDDVMYDGRCFMPALSAQNVACYDETSSSGPALVPVKLPMLVMLPIPVELFPVRLRERVVRVRGAVACSVHSARKTVAAEFAG
jgi:hypothetical protein